MAGAEERGKSAAKLAAETVAVATVVAKVEAVTAAGGLAGVTEVAEKAVAVLAAAVTALAVTATRESVGDGCGMRYGKHTTRNGPTPLCTGSSRSSSGNNNCATRH